MLPQRTLTIAKASLVSKEMVTPVSLLLLLKMESALIAIPGISVLTLRAVRVSVPLTCVVAESPPWLSRRKADALTPVLLSLP